MLAYVVRRILWLIPVLIIVAAITFTLMHQVPGGPWSREKKLPPDAQLNLERKYGLDKPLWRQFGQYLVNLAQGDLGVSYRQLNRPVRDILWEKIPVTATLGLLALAVAVVLGGTFGLLAALRQNTLIDYASVTFATFGASVPSFVLGMLLLITFSAYLHWLPTSGWGTWRQAIMPVTALSVLPTAYIARVTRASMLEVLQQDYIRTARAKGLRENVVVIRHLVRNGLIPVLTVIGPVAAALVTGSFVIEYLFAIPGVGRFFVTSISARDYGMIMGTTLFYTTIVVFANLIVDLLYAVVDPRIRYN
ncbi:MAG TPA: ABC transporter permease [Dehalococcoidia bacterium]|nr:ABC transporter permease [Dehalococcoidia bacterium]